MYFPELNICPSRFFWYVLSFNTILYFHHESNFVVKNHVVPCTSLNRILYLAILAVCTSPYHGVVLPVIYVI
jgi:hypothetical protein